MRLLPSTRRCAAARWIGCLLGLLASAAFADWPTHRGPAASGSAVDCGRALIDDLAQARLIWFSQEKTPSAYGIDLKTPHGFIQGGYASPVVADGKVYLYYWVPAGPVCDEEYVQKGLADPRASLLGEAVIRQKYAILADDVVLCIDAATGKTLWKSVQKQKGFNFSKQGRGVCISVKGAPRLDVTVGGGKVYSIGSAGRIYALDAATGRLVWESKLNKISATVEAAARASLQAKKLEPPRAGLTVCPLYVDGIVAVEDDDGLWGLDAATGKPLWGPVPGWRHAGGSCPLRWNHHGKDYIIAESTCIDPKTGQVLWKVDAAVHSDESGCVAIAGDHLVFSGGGRRGVSGLQCYKIAPTGATRLWALGPEFAVKQFASPVIHRGHIYTRAGGENGDTKMICVELATGKVVARADCPGSCNEVVATDGRIFYEGSYQGPTMYDADPKNFRVLSTGTLKGLNFACSVPPAIADGRMYYRSNVLGVMCLDLRKGSTAGKPVTDFIQPPPAPPAKTVPPPRIPPPAKPAQLPDIDEIDR